MVPGSMKMAEVIKTLKEKFRLHDRFEYQITAVNDSHLTSVTMGQNITIAETVQKLRGVAAENSSRRLSFWKSTSVNQLNFIAKEAETLFRSDPDLHNRGRTELEVLTQCRFVLNRNIGNSNYGIAPFYVSMESEIEGGGTCSQRLAVNAAMSVKELVESYKKKALLTDKYGTRFYVTLGVPGHKEEILLPDSESLLVILARYSEYDLTLLKFKVKEQISLNSFKPVLHISLSTSEFDPFNELQFGIKNSNGIGNRISWDSHLQITNE